MSGDPHAQGESPPVSSPLAGALGSQLSADRLAYEAQVFLFRTELGLTKIDKINPLRCTKTVCVVLVSTLLYVLVFIIRCL